MTILNQIALAKQKSLVLDDLFTPVDKLQLSKGVWSALWNIEQGVAERLGSKEWFALVFNKPGIPGNRMIVTPQTSYEYEFSSIVKDDVNRGLAINEAIDKAKNLWGPEYGLSILVHSHHNLPAHFSTTDHSAFPVFLSYIYDQRWGLPVEFVTGARNNNVHFIDDLLVICPIDEPRKPVFEFKIPDELLDKIYGDVAQQQKDLTSLFKEVKDLSLEQELKLRAGLDKIYGYNKAEQRKNLASLFQEVKDLSIKEQFLISEGYSVVFNRKGMYQCMQGFRAEVPISGGFGEPFMHRMRHLEMEIVDMSAYPGEEDFSITPQEIDYIITNNLHIPKPEPVKNPPMLERIYGTTPITKPVTAKKEVTVTDDSVKYEFVSQAFQYLQRFRWPDQKYTTSMSNALGKIVGGHAKTLSGAILKEYSDNGFNRDAEVVQYKDLNGINQAKIRAAIMDSTAREMEFMGGFCYSGLKGKDKLIEKYVQDLTRPIRLHEGQDGYS